MTRNLLLSGVAAIALGAAMWAPSAKADLIEVGWAGGAGPSDAIAYVASGPGFVSWANPVVVNGTTVVTTGQAQSTAILGAPAVFDSGSNQSVTVANFAGTAGALVLYVTASGLNFPLTGLRDWIAQFTLNNAGQRANLSDAMSIWFDTADTATYANLTALEATATQIVGPFTDLNTTVNLSQSITDPFSVTEEFLVSFTGNGTANDTINLTAKVPEPASLALFGAGLFGLGVFRRRRKKS
jgi:hypothetical protein